MNVPREVVQAARTKGLEALTPEQRALLPPRVDTESAEHQRLFRAFFGEADALHGNMPDAMFQGMYRAQCTWDAAMGWNALQALRTHGSDKAVMVVLVRLGPRRLRAGRRAPGAAVVRRAHGVGDPHRGARRGRGPLVGKVRASYADFVWGLPPTTDPLYPSVGLSTPEQKSGERYKVISVVKDSPAAAAGFQVGDELVSIDGAPYADKESVNQLIAGKRWGDRVEYKLLRGGQELGLTVLLRRHEPRQEER